LASDEIAIIQPTTSVLPRECQVWKLTVHPDRSATLTCDDATTISYSQEIEYTDFPLDEITLYFAQRHSLAKRVLTSASKSALASALARVSPKTPNCGFKLAVPFM